MRIIIKNVEESDKEKLKRIENENAELLLDSALKDEKIKKLEVDIADMMLMLASGKENLEDV